MLKALYNPTMTLAVMPEKRLWMLKYFSFCFFSLLWFAGAFAQQQITDFPNEENVLPNIKYCDQLNDKVLFSVVRREINSTELWISDGTQKGTNLLKNYEDDPYYSLTNFVSGSHQLYFLINKSNKKELWKTDGTLKNTGKVFESNALYDIQVIHEKLVLIFIEYDKLYQPFQFASIDVTEKINIWESDISSYNVYDNKLHYTTYNARSASRLKVYDGAIKTLTEEKQGFTYIQELLKYQNHYYYCLSNQSKKYILISNLQDSTINKLYNLDGRIFDSGVFIRDTQQALYLIKSVDRNLWIYKATKANTLQEIAHVTDSDFGERLSITYNTYKKPIIFEDNILMTDNKASNDTRLLRYNFKKNEYAYSVNLVPKFSWFDCNIIPRSTDVYELESRNFNCIYDFSTNELAKCVGELANNNPNTSIQVQTKTKTFEFSDNIYLIENYKRTPLFQTKILYNPSSTQIAYQDTLNNQLLFWTYTKATERNQLWVSDGQQTKLIYEYNILAAGTAGFSITKRWNEALIYTLITDKEFCVYRTDGTTGGTKKLTGVEGSLIYLISIRSNEKTIAYRVNIFDQATNKSQQLLIMVDVETLNVNTIDVSEFRENEVYATTTDIYITNRVENNKYALYGLKEGRLLNIDVITDYTNDGSGKTRLTGLDKLFYMRKMNNNYGEIMYVDSSMKSKSFYLGVENFVIYDKYLLAYYKNQGMVFNLNTQDTYSITGSTNFKQENIKYYKGRLVFYEDKTLYIYQDNHLEKVSLHDKIYEIQPLVNGVFMRSYSNFDADYYLYFYEFSAQKLSEITKTKGSTDIQALKDDNLIFIISDTKKFIWNIALKRLLTLPGEVVGIIESTENFLVVNKMNDYNSVSVLTQQDSTFSEKYTFNYNYLNIHSISKIDSAVYLSYYEFSKGAELLGLTRDSIYFLPEIVKGREGIELKKVFSFKNDIYVWASTYTYGTQIWRMTNVAEETLTESSSKMVWEPEWVSMNVYPNPVQEVLNIEVQQPSKIQLIKTDGRVIMQLETVKPTTELNISDLATGIYLIRVSNEKGVFSRKIIKL